MLTGKVISNCIESDIDTIKLASLYYDKLDVIGNVLYDVEASTEDGYGYISGITECREENFCKNIKLLESEGIVDFRESMVARS